MLLEALDLTGQPSEPKVHTGPISFDGQVQYGGRTPEEEMHKLQEEEEVEYAKQLKRRGLKREVVGDNYPEAITLEERGKLHKDIRTGALSLAYWDETKMDNVVNPVATKGIRGDSDFALGSMPGSSKELYNETVWICLCDNIEFCIVFEGEWERIWFRVWSRNIEHAVDQGKTILVLTKDDGTVGFNQTIEISFLKKRGISFITMRVIDFVSQRLPMIYAPRGRIVELVKAADPVFVRPLLTQTNFKGESALSTYWDRNHSMYKVYYGEDEHLEVVKTLLGAKASVSRAERAFQHLARMRCLPETVPYMVKLLELFLQHRVNVNSGDNIKATALHWAAMRSGADGVVHLLREHKADVDARDTKHKATPLEWAEYNDVATPEEKAKIIEALTG